MTSGFAAQKIETTPKPLEVLIYQMLRKRSVTISGHRTSISLEDEFWDELVLISKHREVSLNELVSMIDKKRDNNLSSAIRIFVLKSLKVGSTR